jgi:hypothetical protein
MKIRIAAVTALATLLIATPALARHRSTDDKSSGTATGLNSMNGMPQSQDEGTQKQRHSKRQHKKRHARKHSRRHQDDTQQNGLQPSTLQQNR